MQLEQRIEAFVQLGNFLRQFSAKEFTKNATLPYNEKFYNGFIYQLKLAQEHNAWFTQENLIFAISNWANALQKENLEAWLNNYSFTNQPAKKIAVIMAGNIPLVGFHDFLSVLIAGHSIIVKQSSNDKYLLPFLAKYLETVDPKFNGKIEFAETKLNHFDAVIATGSNNTARYFEYYFKDTPSIIRKNRNAIAVLTGNETTQQLEALSEDIFRYYGLGCRNVSKLFVPKNYNFDAFFNAMYAWHTIITETKYANNYDYNKAVYLMSEFKFLDNGFLMVKEDTKIASPIATVFYEYYTNTNELHTHLISKKEAIQCVVSSNFSASEIPFGTTQHPKLNDYADQVDTLAFLLKLR